MNASDHEELDIELRVFDNKSDTNVVASRVSGLIIKFVELFEIINEDNHALIIN